MPVAIKRGEIQPPRRFYSAVTVAPSSMGFCIHLDGRTPRTPGGVELSVPARGLAEMLAIEWSGQGDFIEFAEMPATRLANTVLDGMQGGRAKTEASIVEYAASDLMCYLADGPASLVRRQLDVWTPLLEWARRDLGLDFVQTTGIVHKPQPAETLARVGEIAAHADDFTLTGLAFAVSLFGSSVLGLALREGFRDAAAALEASRVEETFQEERWGVDEEAAARTRLLLRDALVLERWFAVLRQG
jgi:chaperone required for assembly of F1-ATPase